MIKLLVDSSVWINFLKDNITQQSSFLEENIDRFEICTCPIIVHEVLQGINSDYEFYPIKTYFDKLTLLNDDPYDIAVQAALLYRKLRKTGKTIRKANDCLIALYAIENSIMLLHNDKDFDFIATGSNLQIFNV
ncbi:MAG: PIN domain nuclease [Sphingobacteriaceae bacterium]|nr:MAG: PIN domain nuclease [Sphingobacteriaceae bacterium]